MSLLLILLAHRIPTCQDQIFMKYFITSLTYNWYLTRPILWSIIAFRVLFKRCRRWIRSIPRDNDCVQCYVYLYVYIVDGYLCRPASPIIQTHFFLLCLKIRLPSLHDLFTVLTRHILCRFTVSNSFHRMFRTFAFHLYVKFNFLRVIRIM